MDIESYMVGTPSISILNLHTAPSTVKNQAEAEDQNVADNHAGPSCGEISSRCLR